MLGAALVEVGRVQAHLLGAETLLDARSDEGLDPAQRLTRKLLRAELAHYREEGRFPKNRDFPDGRRPYFIDRNGTRCAMAHLMELGGAGALVAEIARTKNNAYVEELARDPRVGAWLHAAGLTPEEAARIQPEYCMSDTPARCVCLLARATPDAGTTLVYEGTILSAPDAGGAAVARVDAVYGGDGAASHVGTERAVQEASRPFSPGERILAGGSLTTVVELDIAVATLEQGETLGSTCLLAGNYATLPPLSKAEATALIGLSEDACEDALVARDPAWDADACSAAGPAPGASQDASLGPGDAGDAETASPPEPSRTGGCDVAGASSAESLSVLAAVVSALAFRRWALRR
jgi:hypothetical protein